MVKLFIAEAGSDELIRLLQSTADDSIHISSLATVEVHSAIRRLQREERISGPEARLAVTSVELFAGRVQTHPTSKDVYATAKTLLSRYALRAMDSLQLATALVVRQSSHQPELKFIAADKRLLEAVTGEGLQIWGSLS